MPIGVDWTEARSLEETVIKFFEARNTDSGEFKALLQYHGRERLAKIYEKWKKDKAAQQGGDPSPERVVS